MKAALLTFIAALSMVTFFSSGDVYAQDSGKTAEEKKTVISDKMKGMDMNHMSGMKHDCMKEHKNKKMCDEKMMKKCEEKMGADDCSKTMKDMEKKHHK